MPKNKNKSAKEGKKKESKKEIADLVADAVADLARKSTKRIIKSMEKRAGKLVAKITPGNFKIAEGAKTGKKKKERAENANDLVNNKPADKKTNAKRAGKKSSAE